MIRYKFKKNRNIKILINLTFLKLFFMNKPHHKYYYVGFQNIKI